MDIGHKQADRDLDKLARRIVKEYNTAYRSIKKKADDYFAKFEEADKKMFGKVDAGQITRDEYLDWRRSKMIGGDNWNNTVKAISRDYANIAQVTADMTGEQMEYVYANNFNYGTFELESASGINTNFTLYNKDTVRELLTDNPQLLPKPSRVIKKAERWNMKKVNSALTQGILQGDSIDNIAKRLRRVTDMNISSSIRNARTMTTRAENSGRLQAYERVSDMGIEIKKVWVASIDDRTRQAHIDLDGQEVELDEKFVDMDGNELEYPADPSAAPETVYNCRCTMIAVPFGFNKEDFLDDRISELDYDEWKERRK